jgi:hypothetical protein
MEKVFEALERLKTAPSFMGGTEKYRLSSNSQATLLEDYELVKQALLKAQEQKRALEIIKEKKIDVVNLCCSLDAEGYNLSVELQGLNDSFKITQEEFNLLDEVLKNV